MADSAPSACHWDAGKSSKKPRKQEGEETKLATGVITLQSAPPQPNDDALQLQPTTMGTSPGAVAESPPWPVKLSSDLPSVMAPSVSMFPTVHDAARAFDQLRVHTVPKENINTASTSDDGAVQPPSPRKRKATGSLRADSSVIIHEENKRSSGNDQAESIAHSGPLDDLMEFFGQIQLNKDLYDAIARTESQTGFAGERGGRDRSDADRAAFATAVSAVTSLVRDQMMELAIKGPSDAVAFLQSYATSAISAFAQQATESEDLEEVSEYSTQVGGRTSTENADQQGVRQLQSSRTERGSDGHIGEVFPKGEEGVSLPPPFDKPEQGTVCLERSASAMAVHSPLSCGTTPTSSRGGLAASSCLPDAQVNDHRDEETREEATSQGALLGGGPEARLLAQGREAGAKRPCGGHLRPNARPGKALTVLTDISALRIRDNNHGGDVRRAECAVPLPQTLDNDAEMGSARRLPHETQDMQGQTGLSGLKRDPHAANSGGEPSRASIQDPPKRQRKGPGSLPMQNTTRSMDGEYVATTGSKWQKDKNASPGDKNQFEVSKKKRDDIKTSPKCATRGNVQPRETELGIVPNGNEEGVRSGSKGTKIRKGKGQDDAPLTGGRDLPVSDSPREGKAEPNTVIANADKVASCGSNPRRQGEGRDEADDCAGEQPLGPRAAWGASLVCADLTLHDVASTWWPGLPQVLGDGSTGKALRGSSIDGDKGPAGSNLGLTDMTMALEESITKAYLDAIQKKDGKVSRLTTSMKSLVAATAFDELIREQQEVVEWTQLLHNDAPTTKTDRHDGSKNDRNEENE